LKSFPGGNNPDHHIPSEFPTFRHYLYAVDSVDRISSEQVGCPDKLCRALLTSVSSQPRGKHYGTALNPYGGSASAFGSLAEGPGKWNGKEHQGTIRKNLNRLMPHYWGVGIGVSSCP